jgi:hypothetical protein
MAEQDSYYEQWQQQRYGNVLPASELQEEESGELIMQQQLVWFEREQEIWLEEQSF